MKGRQVQILIFKAACSFSKAPTGRATETQHSLANPFGARSCKLAAYGPHLACRQLLLVRGDSIIEKSQPTLSI